MGRPIEIQDEDVIWAGGAILGEGRSVNATRLWVRLGKRGRPERLLAVWTRHVDISATKSHEPSSPVAVLPEAASQLLSDCKTQIGAGLNGCVREIYAAIERTLVARFQAEMAAMTTLRDAHQAELHGVRQALGELAEEHDAALLQVHHGEREVLTAHATLEAERGVLSRLKEDKGALSARIDKLTADLAAASCLARTAEMDRAQAETLAEAVQAELDAMQAALEAVRAANLDLDREVCAAHRACQRNQAQPNRQVRTFQEILGEVADAREQNFQRTFRAAGAERALEELERVMADNAGLRTAGSNLKRSRRRRMTAFQTDATRPSSSPGADDDDRAPRLAA